MADSTSRYLDRFSLKQAMVLLISGLTASGDYMIEDALKEIEEVCEDYRIELKKSNKN